jgi:galactokinase
MFAKFLASILRRIHTVDGAVAALNKSAARLGKARDLKTNEATAHAAAARKLQRKAQLANAEADRAQRVQEKLDALLS